MKEYEKLYVATQKQLDKINELNRSIEKIDNNYYIKNNPMIIYTPSIKHKSFDNLILNDTDIVPTILNLYGFDYEPKYFIGNDVFSKDFENIAYFTDYSWYDGNTFSLSEKAKSNINYKKNSKYVKEKLDLNAMILRSNYFSKKKIERKSENKNEKN